MSYDPKTPVKSSPGLLRRSTKLLPADPTTSYAGKTVLITGANVGLGFEAAVKFAALGASTLILAVRSMDKGNTAKAEIERRTTCKRDVIHVVKLDMNSYHSIKDFVTTVSSKYPKIDVAVLNAGLAPASYNKSPTGYEESLQVNVISTTYLAILLLPKLRETSQINKKPSCLEFVSSISQGNVKVEEIKTADGKILPAVNDEKTFNFLTQYSNTKLLETWAFNQIASRVPSSQVIVVSCCPSLCRSDLGRNFGFAFRIADGISKRIFGRSPEEGSRTLVSATSLGQDAHGGLWWNDHIQTQGILVVSEEGKALSDQFWNETMEILLLQNPEISKILDSFAQL